MCSKCLYSLRGVKVSLPGLCESCVGVCATFAFIIKFIRIHLFDLLSLLCGKNAINAARETENEVHVEKASVVQINEYNYSQFSIE